MTKPRLFGLGLLFGQFLGETELRTKEIFVDPLYGHVCFNRVSCIFDSIHLVHTVYNHTLHLICLWFFYSPN